MRSIELLAPAKNLECGIAAIDHGADAVYIGASDFGARHAAGNSVDDIRRLCEYAHQYAAKVYATLNTIIYDSELDAAQHLAHQLADAGVDALLLQDMGLFERLKADGLASRIELHASTQTDNRSIDKARWLHAQGFSRVVLARELTTDDICAVHAAVPDVELEVFVHGALCVSYSGQCYASQHCFGRSANRGECAQMCRMRYTLLDADGTPITLGGREQAYYLSLKDQCQIDNLEAIIDAGACSLKIEGRLKDVAYVKNVVAAYSQRLDAIIARHNAKVSASADANRQDAAQLVHQPTAESLSRQANQPSSQPDRCDNAEPYCRASWGRVELSFTPDLQKSFNRGYTDYFIHGRHHDIASFFTPKAIGEYVGKVKEVRGSSFNVAGTAAFVNGDGLCYIDGNGELRGFRVNRAEGNRLYPLRMPSDLHRGMPLYRSQDQSFDKLMSGDTARRVIDVRMTLSCHDHTLTLAVEGVRGLLHGEASQTLPELQDAKTPQDENIRRQLTKLGTTIYRSDDVVIDDSVRGKFIPSSVLAELRRHAIDSIACSGAEPVASVAAESVASPPQRHESERLAWPSEYHQQHPYLYNAANHESVQFYAERGCDASAYELATYRAAAAAAADGGTLLMQCRHCLRYALGYCVKHGGRRPEWKEPLSLRLADGRSFRLEFDCRHCQMNVYSK